MALLGATAADEDVTGHSDLDTDAMPRGWHFASLSDWPGSRQLQQQQPERPGREEYGQEPTEEPEREPDPEPTERPAWRDGNGTNATSTTTYTITTGTTYTTRTATTTGTITTPTLTTRTGTSTTTGTVTTGTSTTTGTLTTGTSTTTGTETTATRMTRTGTSMTVTPDTRKKRNGTSTTGTMTTYTVTTTDTITTGTSATETYKEWKEWKEWTATGTSTTTYSTITHISSATRATSTATSTISTGTSTTTDAMTTNTLTAAGAMTSGAPNTTHTATYTATNTTATHTATTTTYATVTSTSATTTAHTTTATNSSTTASSLTSATSTAFTGTSATAYTSSLMDTDDPEARTTMTTAANASGTDIPERTYTVTSATSINATTDLPRTDLPRTTSTRTTSTRAATDPTATHTPTTAPATTTIPTGSVTETNTSTATATATTETGSVTETNTSTATATTATATSGTSTSTSTATATTATNTTTTATATATTATATTATATTATRTGGQEQAALVAELQQAVRETEDEALGLLLAGGETSATVEGVGGVVVTARRVNVSEMRESSSYTFSVPGKDPEAWVPKSVLELLGEEAICTMAVYEEGSSTFSSSVMMDLGISGAPLQIRILGQDGQPLQGNFPEPILLTLLPTRPVGARCAYWDVANQRWWNDGVNLVDDAQGRFVCATTHLTLFAAFLGEFHRFVACSNARVFTEEGFRSLGHPRWWYRPPMLMVWVILVVQIVQLSITLFWDIQKQRESPWLDRHFFTNNDAYKPDKKLSTFRKLLAGPGKAERLRREFKEVITRMLMGTTLEAGAHRSRIAAGDLKRILKGTTATKSGVMNGGLSQFGSKADFASAAHEKSIAAIRHFQSLDFLHRTMMMFVTLHPLVRLSHYSIRVVYSIRAIMLSVKLFGALLMTAVFFDAGDGMASYESPPECELSGVWELVYKNIVIGLASAFLAAIPLLLIYQMSSRTFTYQEDWEEGVRKNQRRNKMIRWRLEDACIVGLGILFCSFALLFVMTFLANMAQSAEAETKFIISSVTLLVEFLLITPVLMALAYVTFVWAAARCWPDVHATVQRRLGLISGVPKDSEPRSPVVAWALDDALEQHEPEVCDMHISDIDSECAESPGAGPRAAALGHMEPSPEIVVTEPVATEESARAAPRGSRPVPRHLSPRAPSPHAPTLPFVVPSPHTPALPPVPPRAFDSLWKSLTKRQEQEMCILVLGPVSAGKTTLLSVLAFGAPREATRVAGLEAETATFNNMVFLAVDVDYQRSCSALLQHSDCKNVEGIIFVVDSSNYEDVEPAREDLWEALAASPGLPLLVFANKQDVPGALGAGAVAERLALNGVENRLWHVQPSSGRTGTGICEGRGWLWCALTSRSAPSSPAAPQAAMPRLLALGT